MSAVITAIANVMAKVGFVEKKGRNTFHNYDYATAADISHALQPLLAAEGLVIIQTEKERAFTMDGALLEITYQFTLAHKGGEVWGEKPVHTGMASAKNTKGGFDDKAANKCHTAARKYFTLALFQIPTGDYDDADKEEDRPVAKPPAPKQAVPKAATSDEAYLKGIGESLSKMITDVTSTDQLDEILNHPDFEELDSKKPAWAAIVAGRAKQKRAELDGHILIAG